MWKYSGETPAVLQIVVVKLAVPPWGTVPMLKYDGVKVAPAGALGTRKRCETVPPLRF